MYCDENLDGLDGCLVNPYFEQISKVFPIWEPEGNRRTGARQKEFWAIEPQHDRSERGFNSVMGNKNCQRTERSAWA